MDLNREYSNNKYIFKYTWNFFWDRPFLGLKTSLSKFKIKTKYFL